MKRLFNEDIENDEKLWRKICLGNEQAFSYIYRKYAKELFSYGAHFTNDHELIKDCIQNVFVRIFRKANSLGHTTNIRFYLLLALKNELFQVFRKKDKIILLENSPSFSIEYTVNNQAVEDEEMRLLLERVNQMLNILSPRQKEAIYYRFIEELSLEEISQIMDISYQSTQNIIQRALKKLRLEYAPSVTLELFHLFFRFFYRTK